MILKKIRVLLVDDQALILDILRRGLANDTMIEIVGTATDGIIAMSECKRLDPDVIILDMEMPRMNGIQFLQHQMPLKHIPTIVLSALTAKDSRVTNEAFEAGAIDFLPKPSGGARELQQLFAQLVTKIKIVAAQPSRQIVRPVPTQQIRTLPSTALDRTAKTNNIILGMGAFDVTNDTEKTLKIFALGSCVGTALFCKTNPAVALAHIVLPSSSTDRDKAIRLPGYFADTGVTILIQKMEELGCPRANIYAKIAGGAKTRAEVGDYFSIGQRNSVAVKATLLKNGIKIISEDIGGEFSRTVFVKPGFGKLTLNHPERGNWEI